MNFARANVFSLAACLAYTLALYFNWFLFAYAVERGAIEFPGALSEGAHIFWYGWLATAAVAGTIAAFVIPRQVAERLPSDIAWVLPVFLVIAVFFYEKRWFL